MATLTLVWTCIWHFYIYVIIVLRAICLVIIRLDIAAWIIILRRLYAAIVT